MDNCALVDPELLPLLREWPSVTLDHALLAAARGRTLPTIDSHSSGSTVETLAVAAAGGATVPLRLYRPLTADGPLPCILHVHGGGFVLGSACEAEPLVRPLAGELECVVVSVDYRLAPEHPFPAALEDCHAALRHLHSAAGDLRIDPRRIGVMGESAGGGLAAALALLTRDRGDVSLAFQHLTFPMLDDRTCLRPPHPVTGTFVWDAASNRFGWTALLGGDPGAADVSPYAAPARATNLSGLPPTYLITGALDLFLDENMDYARRLLAAGVPTEFHVYPGAFHGFLLARDAAIARRALADRADALRRAMAWDVRRPD